MFDCQLDFYDFTCYNNVILMEVIAMSFADEIKHIRFTCFLSQEAFASALGVSFATINRWENGKSIPSISAMKKIDQFCKNNNLNFDIVRVIEEERK